MGRREQTSSEAGKPSTGRVALGESSAGAAAERKRREHTRVVPAEGRDEDARGAVRKSRRRPRAAGVEGRVEDAKVVAEPGANTAEQDASPRRRRRAKSPGAAPWTRLIGQRSMRCQPASGAAAQ
jgi:hypothetical protein